MLPKKAGDLEVLPKHDKRDSMIAKLPFPSVEPCSKNKSTWPTYMSKYLRTKGSPRNLGVGTQVDLLEIRACVIFLSIYGQVEWPL